MTPIKRQALTAKSLIIVAVAVAVVTMTSASVASMASAQQSQTSGIEHTITDFKMTGSPTTSGTTTTYNGTATVTLKKGPASDVPISITVMGPRAMSL
jgi:hypothetical protein